MNADSYFSIGADHNICQDYALSQADEPRPLAIISDGCSSSPHTDIGARILCHGTRTLLLRHGAFPPMPFLFYETPTQQVAELISTPLNTEVPNCLDATLLMAYPNNKGQIEVKVYGDGVIAARNRQNGDIFVSVTRFNNNAPGYPSYTLSPARLQTYSMEHGLRTVESFNIKPDGQLVPTQNAQMSRMRNESAGGCYGDHWTCAFSTEVYDLVAVMSDGVESFSRQDHAGNRIAIPLAEIVPHLMSTVNCNGAFVTRRLKRFLGRFCRDNGWSHYDDLAVAMIHIPKNSRPEDPMG